MSKTRLKSRAIVALVALLGLTSGCWRVHYTSDLPRGITYVQSEHYFLYGLLGETLVDVRRLCPDGAADIVRYAGPIDVLLWMVTIGIYTPAKHAITCAAQPGPVPGAPPGSPVPVSSAPPALPAPLSPGGSR